MHSPHQTVPPPAMAPHSPGISGYRALQSRRWILIGALIPAVFLVMITALGTGSSEVSPGDIVRVLLSGPQAQVPEDMAPLVTIVWDLRLPRILAALLAGLALGATGAVMQIILGNPLADPYMLGISSAASFGAALAIISGWGILAGPWLVAGNAFIFSLLAVGLLMIMSRRDGFGPSMMIMLGLASLFFFQALTTMIQYFGKAEAVKAALFWSMGDLGKADWTSLAFMAPLVLGGMVLLCLHSPALHILSQGDHTASSLGIHTTRIRHMVLIISSLITAGVVSQVGTIGFIGLVAPHLIRIIQGNDARFLIPASGLMGALILALADLLSRVVLAPIMLPVGGVTAFLGVPLFVFLVLRQGASRRVRSC